jgi:hypothetical protein
MFIDHCAWNICGYFLLRVFYFEMHANPEIFRILVMELKT